MKILLSKLLANIGLAVSMGEARRQIFCGAVKLNGEIVEESMTQIDVKVGDIIEIGKRTVIITENHLNL